MAENAAGPVDEQLEEFRAQMIALIPSLRAFARGLCRDRDLADDLAQEAMMRAWAARNSFTLGTNFRAWMFMIVRNQFYTSKRKSARLTSWDPEAAERLLVQPPNQEMHFNLLDLDKALNRLPVQQREMLLLVAGAGMSYEEASDVAGCSLGTVKSRLARGRAALMRLIEGEDSSEQPTPSASGGNVDGRANNPH
jgi:RNA polymerase sigma-70 factor (ECF subfamily)